jgi:hypothetical protein
MPKSCKPLEKLGEGAFGIVWKCVDDEDLRCFVAKEAKITDEEVCCHILFDTKINIAGHTIG